MINIRNFEKRQDRILHSDFGGYDEYYEDCETE
jgi:hypothetical protein